LNGQPISLENNLSICVKQGKKMLTIIFKCCNFYFVMTQQMSFPIATKKAKVFKNQEFRIAFNQQ